MDDTLKEETSEETMSASEVRINSYVRPFLVVVPSFFQLGEEHGLVLNS